MFPQIVDRCFHEEGNKSLPSKKKTIKNPSKMAHRYEITPEELQDIMAYLEGTTSRMPEESTVSKLSALTAALTRKMMEDATSLRKKNFLLEKKLCGFQVKENIAALNGDFAETSLDSAEIAQVLLFCLKKYRTYEHLTKTKVIYILYEMYSSWLATKKERLCAEHPCSTEWGPQFWRAYKRLDVKADIPYSTFEHLAQQNPAVAAYCKNAAAKYYDWKEKDLRNLFTKSEPYRKALPEKNNGKWGKEISDADIFVWKTELNKSKK